LPHCAFITGAIPKAEEFSCYDGREKYLFGLLDVVGDDPIPRRNAVYAFVSRGFSLPEGVIDACEDPDGPEDLGLLLRRPGTNEAIQRVPHRFGGWTLRLFVLRFAQRYEPNRRAASTYDDDLTPGGGLLD
jgi:hypothetical protein